MILNPNHLDLLTVAELCNLRYRSPPRVARLVAAGKFSTILHRDKTERERIIAAFRAGASISGVAISTTVRGKVGLRPRLIAKPQTLYDGGDRATVFARPLRYYFAISIL